MRVKSGGIVEIAPVTGDVPESLSTMSKETEEDSWNF